MINVKIGKLTKIAKKIISLDSVYSKFTDEQLRKKTDEFKQRLNNGETLDDILIEAFAVCREASYRILGMKHFEVQLIGGIILHQGRVAEMKTGEGKTLTELCPAYLNALEGKGVHIATVNNYLAKRDMLQMQPLFNFLGLTVGLITDKSLNVFKSIDYGFDITYTTNTQVGFDYLNDGLADNIDNKVQRKLNYIILDEIDSILIDDASTPLIIGGGQSAPPDNIRMVDLFIKNLKENVHYEVDDRDNSVVFTDWGIRRAEEFFKIDNISDVKNSELHHTLMKSLTANYAMTKEKDYIVKNGEIMLIDVGTGRISEGRRFSDGLHQALEAKEGLEIQGDTITIASITYQNLFKEYNKLSGMSGTVATEEMEFHEIYNLYIVKVPTNKPIQRVDNPDLIFSNEKEKLNAIVTYVRQKSRNGRPILICTPSIEKSEQLSLFKRNSIKHQLLNAKNDESEAKVIAKAGQLGAITIATNMAGRGTDIKISKECLDRGGLLVIGTERAVSRRIDNQIIGRAGRQGNVGESQFFISYEDELFRKCYGEDFEYRYSKIPQVKGVLKGAKHKKNVDTAQRVVEGMQYQSRRETIKFQDVIDRHRKIIARDRDKIISSYDIIRDIRGYVRDVVEDDIISIIGEEELWFYTVKERSVIYKNICTDLVNMYRLFGKYIPVPSIVANILEEEELIDYFTELCIHRLRDLRDQDRNGFRNYCLTTLREVVDENWTYHLSRMEALKRECGFSQMKQVDPMIEYIVQSGKALKELVMMIKQEFVRKIFSYDSSKKILTA